MYHIIMITGKLYCSNECLRQVTLHTDAYVAREVARESTSGKTWGIETVAVTKKLQQAKDAKDKQRLLQERHAEA